MTTDINHMIDRPSTPPPQPRFPLSFVMPLVLLFSVAVATWWSFYLGTRQASKSVRNEAIRDLTWSSSRLESTFERAFRLSDAHAVQEAVAALGANRQVMVAVLTDESYRVLHSMRVAEIGKQMDEILPASYKDAQLLQPDSLSAIRQRKGGKVESIGDGRSVVAAYPVVLGTRSGELRPNRIGNLVVVNDYSSRKADALRVVTRQALSFFMVNSLLAAGLGLFLHFVIARRLNRLASVTQQFGAGGAPVPSGIGGSDEVASLALSIDRMMEQKAVADVQLKESEERYRGLFESTHDMVQSVSPEGGFIFVNPEWKKTLGYSDADLKHMTAFDVIHPDSLEHCRVLFQRVMSGVAVPRLEATFVAKDGRTVVVEGNVTPRRSERSVLATHGFFRDVTQQKQEQAALQERESQLRAILSTAAEGILTIDERGAIESLNPAAEAMFGYKAEDLAGQNINMLMPSPYRQEHDGYLEHYRETGEKRIIGIGRDVVGKRKDGTEFPLELSVSEIKFGERTMFTGFVRDLTERQRSEEVEQSLGRIIDDSLNEIYICSADTLQFLRVNRGARDNIGYSMDELCQLTPMDISPAFSADSVASKLEPLRSGEQEQLVFESVHRRKDNSLYDVEVRLQLTTYQGRPAIVANVLDITDRKRIESELRLQRQALATGATAITFGDLDGNLTYVNRAFLRMWGYEHEDEVVGRPVTDMSSSVEDAAEVFQGLDEHGEWIGERLAKRKDGSFFEIQVSASMVFSDDGQPIATMASFVDISKLKRIEEALRVQQRAVEAAANGVVITDPTQPDNPIVYVNRAMQEITGYSAEEALGRNCRFLQNKDRDQDGLREMRAALIEERECKVVLKNYRKDGTVFWNELTVSPVRNNDGKLTHFVGIQSDITVRKQAEQVLARLNEELEQRVESRTRQLQEAQEQLVRNEKLATLGQLAGGVAHEIRNPLGVIRNAVYFLKQIQTDGDEDVTEALQEISRGLANSERIIGELLDYARGPKPEQSTFPLDEAMSAAMKMVKIPSSVSVTRDAPASIRVHADRGQIERLFANLIQNAIQAMPKGGTLVLRCTAVNGNVITEVSDTGAGIAEDELEKIFEPLFTNRAKGIGLGLPLCRRYAEQNIGTLEVNSILGEGSTFTLTLPMASTIGTEL